MPMSLIGFFWYFTGDYSLVSLLEMIALHLDATDAEYNTWKVFSSCFLRLSSYEEDCMSSCPIQNEDGHKQHFPLNKTPKIFTDGISGKSWRLRCRWWLTRHFSNSKLESEIEAGIYFLVFNLIYYKCKIYTISIIQSWKVYGNTYLGLTIIGQTLLMMWVTWFISTLLEILQHAHSLLLFYF